MASKWCSRPQNMGISDIADNIIRYAMRLTPAKRKEFSADIEQHSEAFGEEVIKALKACVLLDELSEKHPATKKREVTKKKASKPIPKETSTPSGPPSIVFDKEDESDD
ncbi:hypothetical protein BC832DRAFT_594510 [Gaertneriomyces semiglobifer]|nr:hypothetical protein BC832DRAFT_594510 [Gaertneriomyces semiglobifer]